MSAVDNPVPTLKLRGDVLAAGVRESVSAAAAVMAQAGVRPKMAVIIASSDPASISYAQAKQRTASLLGIELDIHDLGSATTQERLEDTCRSLSRDPDLHGILLELPLAPHLHSERALEAIAPEKDIDGMTAFNMGLIATGREEDALASATAQACIMLAQTQGPLEGKKVAVIGRGRTVGRPLACMLVNRHATVTVCHSRTSDLAAAVADCEVVFVAIGKAHQIASEHLRPGQIVVDAGINYLNGKLVGDVDGASVEGIVAARTPVPGGVGPLTSALIFQNLIRAAQRQQALALAATGGDQTDGIDTLWTLPLRAFLSATASAQPTPGGGSVACVSGAFGLGLVAMALEISRNRKDAPAVPQIDALLAESRQLLERIANAADADIAAFRHYMAALRLPKATDDQKRLRAEAMQAAVVGATESPVEAARVMVAALDLATRALPLAHSHVTSDVAAGAGLLDGALKAVLFNVDINLPALRDAGFQAACGRTRVHLAKEGAQLAADLVRAASRSLAGRTEIVSGTALLEDAIRHSQLHRDRYAGKKVVIVLFGRHGTWGEDRYQAYRISAQEKLRTLVAAGFAVTAHFLCPDLSAEAFDALLQRFEADAGVLAVSVQMPVPPGLDACLLRLKTKDLDAVMPGSPFVCAAAEAAVRLVDPWREGGVAVVGAKGFVGSAVCRALAGSNTPFLALDVGDDLTHAREVATLISTASAPEILDARHLSRRHEMVVDIGFCPVGRELKDYVGNVSRAAYFVPRRITETPGGMGPLAMAVLIERLVQRATGEVWPAWHYPLPAGPT